MSTSCTGLQSPAHKSFTADLMTATNNNSSSVKKGHLFSNALEVQVCNEQFSSQSSYQSAVTDKGYYSVPAIDVMAVEEQVCEPADETQNKPSEILRWDDNRNNSSESDAVSLKESQPWKQVKIYKKQELEVLSVMELQLVLEALHSASQTASMSLVSGLQTRHSLEEELELRNVAIEQLLRRAEKHSSSAQYCCPPSPGMTGRG